MLARCLVPSYTVYFCRGVGQQCPVRDSAAETNGFMLIRCESCGINREVKFPRKIGAKCLSCARRSMFGERNPAWKDKPGYIATHVYVRKYKKCDGKCTICSEPKGRKNLEVAKLKHKKYTRNPDDYIWLCRRCHNVYDHRYDNFSGVDNDKIYELSFVDGMRLKVKNLHLFCRLNGLRASSILRMVSGKGRNHWKIIGAKVVH